MKQRAHIDISTVVGSEMCQLQEKQNKTKKKEEKKKKKKLPGELGVVKTTPAQTKPPKKGGVSFGWTEFKMQYHCCEFKMAVFCTHKQS